MCYSQAREISLLLTKFSPETFLAVSLITNIEVNTSKYSGTPPGSGLKSTDRTDAKHLASYFMFENMNHR